MFVRTKIFFGLYTVAVLCPGIFVVSGIDPIPSPMMTGKSSVAPSGIIEVNTPPLEFPNDNKAYTIVESDAALSHLPISTDSSASSDAPATEPSKLESTSGKVNLSSKNDTIFKQLNESVSSQPVQVQTPPSIFPSEDDPRYTFLENATALENLLQTQKKIMSEQDSTENVLKDSVQEDSIKSHPSSSNKSGEVEDLLHFTNIKPFTEVSPKIEPTESLTDEQENQDVELIEDDGGEDKKIMINNEIPIVIEDKSDGIEGQTAIILASVFMVMAVIAYALLMTWRRWLERRYGSRQLLVEEDDDDLKHFSI